MEHFVSDLLGRTFRSSADVPVHLLINILGAFIRFFLMAQAYLSFCIVGPVTIVGLHRQRYPSVRLSDLCPAAG